MTEERENQQCFIKFLQLNISFLTWPRFKTHRGIIAIIAYNCFYRSVSRQRTEITRGERSAARSDQSRACCDMQHMQFGRFVSTRSCCLFRSCGRLPCCRTQQIFSIRNTVTVFYHSLSPWALSKFKLALAAMCFSCRAANKDKRAAPKSDVHFLSFLSLDFHSFKIFVLALMRTCADSHSNTQ